MMRPASPALDTVRESFRRICKSSACAFSGSSGKKNSGFHFRDRNGVECCVILDEHYGGDISGNEYLMETIIFLKGQYF